MRGRHFKGYLVKDIKTCIGANADIYMERLQKCRSGRITFNWAAAFLTIYWLCYRKLWKVLAWMEGVSCVIYLVGCTIIRFMVRLPEIPSLWVTISESLGSFMDLSKFLILGFFGDWFYWKKVQRILDRNQCFQREPVFDGMLNEVLKKQGGTVRVLPLIGVFLLMLLIEGIVYLAGNLIICLS